MFLPFGTKKRWVIDEIPKFFSHCRHHGRHNTIAVRGSLHPLIIRSGHFNLGLTGMLLCLTFLSLKNRIKEACYNYGNTGCIQDF